MITWNPRHRHLALHFRLLSYHFFLFHRARIHLIAHRQKAKEFNSPKVTAKTTLLVPVSQNIGYSSAYSGDKSNTAAPRSLCRLFRRHFEKTTHAFRAHRRGGLAPPCLSNLNKRNVQKNQSAEKAEDEDSVECPNPQCMAEFHSRSELEAHLNVIGHHSPAEQVSRRLYDTLRIDWVRRFQNISLEGKRQTRHESEVESATAAEDGMGAAQASRWTNTLFSKRAGVPPRKVWDWTWEREEGTTFTSSKWCAESSQRRRYANVWQNRVAL